MTDAFASQTELSVSISVCGLHLPRDSRNRKLLPFYLLTLHSLHPAQESEVHAGFLRNHPHLHFHRNESPVLRSLSVSVWHRTSRYCSLLILSQGVRALPPMFVWSSIIWGLLRGPAFYHASVWVRIAEKRISAENASFCLPLFILLIEVKDWNHYRSTQHESLFASRTPCRRHAH